MNGTLPRETKLWVMHCSWNKSSLPEGTPRQLYRSARISEFVDNSERRMLPWAILSAKHGLFFPEETRPNYDTTFSSDPVTRQCLVIENRIGLDSQTSLAWIESLTLRTRQKIRSRDIESIVFWPGRTREGPSENYAKRKRLSLTALRRRRD